MNAQFGSFRTVLYMWRPTMPTQSELPTLTADNPKARRPRALFPQAYNRAQLSPDGAQFLAENRNLLARLVQVLRECSVPTPEGGRAVPVRVPTTINERGELILVNFGPLELDYQFGFMHVRKWAERNNLRLSNRSKTDVACLPKIRPKLHRELGLERLFLIVEIDVVHGGLGQPQFGLFSDKYSYGFDTDGGSVDPEKWYAMERI
jgi:hypothetical protein